MLQPTNHNRGLSPTRIAVTGVGIVVVLVLLSTIVHVIVGLLAFGIELAVVAVVALVIFRLFRGSHRG